MQQLSEDVPKVTAALKATLVFAREKLEEVSERHEKGEDAGLPARVAVTILENTQEAIDNLEKGVEKVLNDAKKTPKHYQAEFRRLYDNLAAACAEFEEAASQAAAFHASSLDAAKGLEAARGKAIGAVKMTSGMVKAEGAKIVGQASTMAHNGANVHMPAGVHAKPCQMKVKVTP
jgi:hypothetical protein